MRHQRHFAEPACALVGVQHLVQNLFAAGRLGFDNAAAFDHIGAVRQCQGERRSFGSD